MATKLGIYNASLREVGEGRLASLTESREARHVLDGLYDSVLKYCLEQGDWNFAIRTIQIDSNPSINTEFGFAYAFDKPTDWLKTAALSADEYCRYPLERYEDEIDYWLADVDPIYLRYVSNDSDYGLNLGEWPESFTRYVELELAWRIGKRTSQSGADRETLRRDRKDAKSTALTKDVLNEAPKFNRPGRFVSARMGRYSRDRVGRQLIG